MLNRGIEVESEKSGFRLLGLIFQEGESKPVTVNKLGNSWCVTHHCQPVQELGRIWCRNTTHQQTSYVVNILVDGPGCKTSQAIQQTASLSPWESSSSRSAQEGVMLLWTCCHYSAATGGPKAEWAVAMWQLPARKEAASVCVQKRELYTS